MSNKTISRSNSYSFNVFWSEEDGSYIAVCPEFPILSAFGETAEQALAELKVALDLAIETYQEEGWTLPEPIARHVYSGQFRVRMPKSLHARLAFQAELEHVSLNTLVVASLSESMGRKVGFSRLQEDRHETQDTSGALEAVGK
jgi:antitoxin HicB